jgi:superfamily II DNA or RNA helicase
MRDIIQNEATKIALNNKAGCLAIPMRSGKTKIGLGIASNFKNVLVSYPNISILDSWKSDSQKFNIPIDNIVFTTHLSLNKQNLSLYDCIILDEIDQLSVDKWNYIALSSYNRLYGLTGTPPNKGEKLQFLNNYCPIIYKVTLDETVGILQKEYEIFVHCLKPSKEKNIPLKSGKFWSEESKIQFWENKYKSTRNFMDMLKLIQAIQNSKTKLTYLEKLSLSLGKVLIFLETKQQCEDLHFHSYYSGNKASEDNLKMFQNGFIDKLSCVKQLSSGITFKNLNECIILHAYASNNKAAQRIGRCLNYVEGEKAKIHILCLEGTRDEQWVKQGLEEFDQNKIKWIKI